MQMIDNQCYYQSWIISSALKEMFEIVKWTLMSLNSQQVQTVEYSHFSIKDSNKTFGKS